MTPLRRRSVVLGLAMAGTGALAVMAQPRPLSPEQIVDPRLDALFPGGFGPWRIDPLAQAFVRAVDQHGRVLGVYDRLYEQTFIDDRGYRIMVSAAYIANAFEGSSLQLHRPEVCYRYGGYTVSDIEPHDLPIGERTIPTTRLLATLPGRIEPITYWIVVGNEVMGTPAALRRRRVAAALQRRPVDSLLVRISSIDRERERANAAQDRFAAALAASLGEAAAPRVFGRSTHRAL